MRIAPVGLYFDTTKNWTIEKVAMLGAEIAALTHSHDLGYIPAAAQAYIINAILYGAYTGPRDLNNIITDCLACMCALFGDKPHIYYFKELIESAVDLAHSDETDIDCLHMIGRGSVAEETLAIAVFCALRYKDNFEKAITVSVNHGGDSDSTGAVTGNILGAYHGFHNLPPKFIKNLELKDTILEIAADLCSDYPAPAHGSPMDDIWKHKYIDCDYPNKP